MSLTVVQQTDSRIQSVTEGERWRFFVLTDVDKTLAMNIIRMIKLFGWESRVNDEINGKRDEELRVLKRRQLMELLNINTKYFKVLFILRKAADYIQKLHDTYCVNDCYAYYIR